MFFNFAKETLTSLANLEYRAMENRDHDIAKRALS